MDADDDAKKTFYLDKFSKCHNCEQVKKASVFDLQNFVVHHNISCGAFDDLKGFFLESYCASQPESVQNIYEKKMLGGINNVL